MHRLRIVDIRSGTAEADDLQRVLTHGRSVDAVDHSLEVQGFFILAVSGRVRRNLAHFPVGIAWVVAGDADLQIVGAVTAMQAQLAVTGQAPIEVGSIPTLRSRAVSFIDAEELMRIGEGYALHIRLLIATDVDCGMALYSGHATAGRGNTWSGAAIRDGAIKNLDDPVSDYIDELSGSAYAEVTVEQLLTMTSGIAWNEDAMSLLDEHPDAYKDIGEVMENQKDLVKVEHRLETILNYKGT